MLAFLFASLGMGLFGSLHCLGMCGGLMAALSFGIPAQSSRLPLMLLASAGRVISYGLMGALAGALLQSFAIGPWPRLVAAVLLILTGLYLAGWWNLLTRLETLGAALWRRLEPLRKRCLPIDSSPKAIGFGLLWGALPCGLVYSALTYTATAAPSNAPMPQALAAALGMLAFGLGTSPAVLIGGAMASQLKSWLQKPLLKPLLGVSYIAFGLWTGFTAFGHHHHHPMEPSSTHGQHEGHDGHMNHEHHH
ncbi:MAG TPA: sulfite exporter TauE/SafE family protein [Cellvibrionaceae bacterium]|nr:sulfite exporter TauE/SafE family protein [Cellvibrionaceae bacterium]HMW72936.1 sulfite exporter TauE/SafE family protein [Cellvibrionaceae bacterium]HMY38563.1 sulfite exporter TauE/SafE family protein [Marinagarivorans sp.]HNG61958.1 sulfite exporter TauE/SafE family protein [Cellvibrionaceae bacterium]